MARHRSARSLLVPLALTLVLILSPTSLAQEWGSFNPPFFPAGQTSQSQTRLKRDTHCRIDCQIDQLSANDEPSIRIEAEAGVNEIWDPREQKEFQCAGVTVVRTQVESNGLFLPHYYNAPSISYVIRGKALLGVTNPGCPETFEYGSSEPFSSERDPRRPGHKFERPEREFESTRDQHQKIRRVYQGHIVALPAGVSKWFYNDGQDRLTIVTLFDTLNNQNQLDDILRSFFLAGNPQGREGGQGGKGSQRIFSENNIMSGFDKQLLSQAFGIEPETVSKIQGQNDDRGAIIRVEGDLGLLIPEWDREESRRQSESYRPGQGSKWDPRYPGRGSQRPSHGSEWDPRYPGHGSQRPGSEWDPRYPGHGSQRPTHGSERDPRYPGHGSQRPAHGSEWDPRYPGHESQRPGQGSQWEPSYPGHGSQRPGRQDPYYPGQGGKGQERICGGRRCICEENGVCKPNGIEETLCSVRITENIDNPEKADVYNPQGGRLTSLNSHKLPILNYLQLSAEKVNLYQNAMMAPNWKINAHSIVYFTKGNGRVQIASNEGRLVFDDMVQEGQLLVVPQNFVVLKKAGQEGLEWVAFLTSDQAMISPLAGRISAIRGLPEQVVMNSFGLSREEAKRLKYGRQELTVFSPSEEFQRKGQYAIM